MAGLREGFMRFSKILILIIALMSLGMLSAVRAQQSTVAPQANPVPPSIRPNYNYTEAFSCTACHFVMGTGGDHNLEAVGVSFDDTAKQFNFTGGGWLNAKHSESNHGENQNTYCARCHSPLQASPKSSYKNGIFKNTDPIPNGQMEAVTCATCHPSHTVAAALGRRLGVYQLGMDRNSADAYKVVAQGDEDSLCLNCHVVRHNTTNPVFAKMYDVGVRCIDCHMAVYGAIASNPSVPKREHDWKVGNNLPYSCGVEGSVVHCHPGFTVQGTRDFIPYIKEQHSDWPMPGKNKGQSARNQTTTADYMSLWSFLDAQARANGAE
jgi:hypothetical protein